MRDARTVVDALLRRKPALRMGMFESFWPETLPGWVAQGYPAGADGKPLADWETLGFDMVGAGGWFDEMPIRGPENVVQETDEWIVKRNGAGAARKWWKKKSGTPEHIDFLMTSRAVWDRDYRPHLLAADRDRIDIAGSKKNLARCREAGVWPYYGHLFIWEGMRQSMGDTCLYESLLLDPEWIHDYSRVYTDFYKAHYRLLFAEAGLPDGVWMYEDLGYCNGLFCSPRTLDQLIFPYYREMVEFFHGYDLPVVLHSCGQVVEALPLIVQTGFDGLNPMEVKAGNDLFKFAEQYGDKLAFVGGMDVRILESNDLDLIGREVVRLTKGMKERDARWVFGSDHSISPNVTYAAYQHAVKVFREHCEY